MYKVYKLERDKFMFINIHLKEEMPTIGTLIEITNLMEENGISTEEIKIGILSLIESDHDFADYGVNKCFIFSANNLFKE